MPVASDPNFQYGQWLSSPLQGEEVVISGISGRLPESNNVHEFRDQLFAKKDMVTDTGRRWKVNHPQIPKRNAKIYDIDKFDAGNFGIHYRQADTMDPVMRTFLEVAVEAVVDAGMNPAELQGTRTGVYVSHSISDFENEALKSTTKPQSFTLPGYLRSVLAHRVSYYLKLKGPAFNVDSACSSSLNGLDTAFRAIRSGQCDNALVGGVNLLLHPGSTLQFFRTGVLSIDGNCKVFDQSANGYVRGESVACVFLQRAKYSRRIYAQIVNAKVNIDGFKEQGLTFPSTEMQHRLMTEIYNESGIHPDDVSFIEAHGTGTTVGDLQEEAAIDGALGSKRTKTLLIGSVKSSIGHTEPVSGICSIIKVLIAMETGLIAPNINFQQIKQGMLGLEEGRMKVVTELTVLKDDEAIVGINNFGFGGNNAHVILKRFQKKQVVGRAPHDDVPRLICVSGRTEESVRQILDTVNSQVCDHEYIGLLHHVFKENVANDLYRGYTVVSKAGALKTSLKYCPNRSPTFSVYFGRFQRTYKVLGSQLLHFPVVRKTISRIDNILSKHEIDNFEKILDNGVEARLNILGAFVVQMSIVEIFKTLGLQPTSVYGDSWGKIVTGYYHKVVDLEEAVQMAIKIANSPPVGTKIQFPVKKADQSIISDKNFENILKIKNGVSIPSTASREIFILNVSDSHLNKHDTLLTEGTSDRFLDVLGMLYERGHNLRLHKLYPEVDYPVNRGTPMISPVLKWDHSKSWYTHKFTEFTVTNSEQRSYYVSFLYDVFKFIAGHVIDGRNLFPATEYLNLVWETFAQSRGLLKVDLPVVFEKCKFIRAVTMPETGIVKLLVSVHRGTGLFEVSEKDEVVVRGRIYTCDNITEQQTPLEPLVFDDSDPARVMEHEEIYRELYLRGYNYSGVFKGISKCDVEATTALVKWEDNWSSFMDKMLQMKIFQNDSRALLVPVGIEKLIIDPAKRCKTLEDEEEEETFYSVHLYKECNVIKSEGIEIRGLQAKSIAKRKPRLEPVLEKHVFVPNESVLDLAEAVRVNMQIILENSLDNNFKAVEIIDNFTNSDSDALSSLVCKALDDVPLVTPDLTLSTKEAVEDIPGVKIEDFIFTPDSNLGLIVGSKMLQRPGLHKILESLKPDGFVLTREQHNFSSQNLSAIEVVTEFLTGNEKLILFRRTSSMLPTKVVEISSQDFKWLPQLQKALKDEPSVLVYAQNCQTEGVLGLANCLRRESSGHKVRCYFIVDQAPTFDVSNRFYAEQIRKNLAVNVYKNGKWGTYRHLLLEDLQEVECERCYGNVTVRGDLSSLRWIEDCLPQSLGKGKTLISTYYSAINFRDIMAASGRISVDTLTTNRMEQECVMGIEFSGKDSNGRRFMGVVGNKALSNLVVANTDFLWEVPQSWTLEDAATVPVVYATVLYALLFAAKLKRGSSILIHSATGGIGLAALNVCSYYDCDIYVTVGTQEKREYLRKHYPQIPESHIGNSRDLSFETMVKTETKDRGVDVVLNSLSEEKLKASVRCLSVGGHFLEIGKFDIGINTELDLLFLRNKVSYHGIMLDQIDDSELKIQLGRTLRRGIEAGYVKPLPRIVFPMREVEQAHRYMMTGKHMGKVLVNIRAEEDNRDALPDTKLYKAVPRYCCDPEKSYVIIGGLGGVGLELADWLVLRGATKLVLVSRNGVQTGYRQQRIELWQSYGVRVKVSTSDVTTKAGCLNLIREAGELGPVDAIFNLAAVLRDTLFEDQTEESFKASLEPKAQATLYLDQLTREKCPELRHFVVFSSVSCGLGNAGQTNYGMANSIMERICEKRQRDGFPAVAIQWGAIGDVGLVAKMQKENKELVIGGTLQQKIASCLEVLDKLLKQDNPVVSSMVVAEKHSRNLGILSPIDAVASVLGIQDTKAVSQHATLAELGMDSMMGTEVLQILEKEFQIYLTTKEVRVLTLAKLAEIEADNKTSSEEKSATKAQSGMNFMIQHIPDRSISDCRIIELANKGESARKVFILPGAEGVFKPFECLVAKLGVQVLGVQYSYDRPEDTVTEAAENLVPHIELHLNKNTNFVIIGYSTGSLVGLEIVRLLESKGFKGTIIMLEGSPTYISSSAKTYVPGDNEAEFQTSLVCKLLEMLLPIHETLQYKDKLLQCADLQERIDVLLSLVPADISNQQKLDRQAIVALYKRIKAIRDYNFVHDKIKSDVCLFKAMFPMIDEEEDYQLSKVCQGKVVVTTIEGNHATMLNQDELVCAVNKCVNAAL